MELQPDATAIGTSPVQTPEEEDDERFATSRAYQAIKDLRLADKDIAKMLSLASQSILLLTLPQTDNEEDGSASLPKGEERSEQFVLEVSEYFQLLDTIQEKIREAIARVRQYRINPSVIDASIQGSIPRTFGVGLPHEDPEPPQPSAAPFLSKENPQRAKVKDRGLQETRFERDSWKNLYELLKREKEARLADKNAVAESSFQADSAMPLHGFDQSMMDVVEGQ